MSADLDLARQLVACPAPWVCYVCSAPATCYGRYEGSGPVEFGCDTHCGHGNEDGWCERIEAARALIEVGR